MFGSQALETAIGLAVMFFVVATGASTILEVISRLLNKRSKDLDGTLKAMFSGKTKDDPTLGAADTFFTRFEGTSIYKAALAAAGKSSLPGKAVKKPSYLSAKAFADAVTELLSNGGTLLALDQLPETLRDRIETITREVGSDLTAIKAGLENWFDDTMGRLEGAYKRWATGILFGIGLTIAVCGNVSTVDVAQALWHDPVTRAAVADAADKVVEEGADAQELESVAATTDKLEELSLPVGWNDAAKDQWTDGEVLAIAGSVVGWLLTALFVMLGGPFWFDLLTKLVSVRSTGAKPPLAGDDKGSATAKLTAERSAMGSTGRRPTREDAESGHGAPVNVPEALASALRVTAPG